MDEENLKLKVREIVEQARALKDKHTNQKDAPVNYACIFSQSKEEYDTLIEVMNKMGKIIKETSMGPVFQIEPLDTVSGKLNLLKIRLPDEKRPEKGDADFTVSDYPAFKEKYLSKEGYKLIERDNFEMIELIDPEFDVLAYFSYPTLGEYLGIK
ncbi:MAG: hypothetical protein ABIE94_02460 [archaeon]